MRGFMLGIAVMLAVRWVFRWWLRFSAPYGSESAEMKGRSYW